MLFVLNVLKVEGSKAEANLSSGVERRRACAVRGSRARTKNQWCVRGSKRQRSVLASPPGARVAAALLTLRARCLPFFASLS